MWEDNILYQTNCRVLYDSFSIAPAHCPRIWQGFDGVKQGLPISLYVRVVGSISRGGGGTKSI